MARAYRLNLLSILFVTGLQLCVGNSGEDSTGRDSCNGDSGGPLVVRKGPNEPFYQIGIVSYGIGTI